MKLIFQTIVFLGLIFNVSVADSSDPRFKAVQEYIINGKDYPEDFKGKHYRMKIEGIEIADLDMNGVDEVVLLVKPHYLQSPTILIYHVDKKMKVTRVLEGLAPGPLKKREYNHLDSHVDGGGIDFEARPNKKDKRTIEEIHKAFAKSALTHESKSHIVQYKNWVHFDPRLGKGSYIDMTHVKVPEDKHTCENFEFSTVDEIAIMGKKEDNRNYLFVKVGDRVYTYKFNKFLDNGLIDKEMAIFK